MLSDGRQFANIDELKQLLLADKDQLAPALSDEARHLRHRPAPNRATRREIDAVVDRIREKEYGLRTLMHEIVQSELFQEK